MCSLCVTIWDCLCFMRARRQTGKKKKNSPDLLLKILSGRQSFYFLVSPFAASPLAHSGPLVMFADPYKTAVSQFQSWEYF